MNAVLPDVSLTEVVPGPSSLEWVGMQGIDLPVPLDEPRYRGKLHARADVQVDLLALNVKSIRMSRLYRLLDEQGESAALFPSRLHQLLQAMIDSHRGGDSLNAWLRLRFALLARRPALVGESLVGWKSSPVCHDAALIQGVFMLRLQVTVTYSSTCPCSVALSRHLVEHDFLKAFAGHDHADALVVSDWLCLHATLTTPYSQRSEADIAVDVAGDTLRLGLLALIDRIELAVDSPLRTAVKRADDQACVAFNGQNLTYAEDATRLQAALDDGYACVCIHVRHLESLHVRDAVAWAGRIRSGVIA